mgnify:CR=1 FL=1
MPKKLNFKILILLLFPLLLLSPTGCETAEEVEDVEEETVTETETAEPDAEEAEEDFNWEDWQPAERETHTNILILGLDNHGFSDAIMIFSYHNETFASSIIALMRDTYVEEQNWAPDLAGVSQITSAHYHALGEDENYCRAAIYTLQWVEHLLGIDLHGYASTTFEGFSSLVDQLGGVAVYVNPGFAERDQNPLPTGTQTLDGEQALSYVRHRSSPRIPEPGSSSEDGDRVRRNMRFLQAILEQCHELSEEELNNIYDQLEESIHTSLDDWDLMILANIYYHTDPSETMMMVLPGEPTELEENGESTYYFMLDEQRTAEILAGMGLRR